jgi:hypothetical protein
MAQTERFNEHTAIKAELETLIASIPTVNDRTLPDELPPACRAAGTAPGGGGAAAAREVTAAR